MKKIIIGLLFVSLAQILKAEVTVTKKSDTEVDIVQTTTDTKSMSLIDAERHLIDVTTQRALLAKRFSDALNRADAEIAYWQNIISQAKDIGVLEATQNAVDH